MPTHTPIIKAAVVFMAAVICVDGKRTSMTALVRTFFNIIYMKITFVSST